MRVFQHKIVLDKIPSGFYATPSMRSPMSPDMLKGAAILLHKTKGGIEPMPAKKKAAKKTAAKKKKK
jgi:hypothetical protein